MATCPILICVPELFREIGGIQNFSRTLIAACDDICGQPVTVLSRNDRYSDCPKEFVKERKIHCVGYIPSRLRPFGLMAASLRYRNHLILTTHPRFAPWLQILQRGGQGRYATFAHGIEVWGDWTPAFKRGMESASRILAVSSFTENSVRDHLNGKVPPIEVFPNAIDSDRFFPGSRLNGMRRRLGIADEATVMLTVTRVAKSEVKKGYRLILESMPRLVQEFPSLVWVLAGKGNDLDDVREFAAATGVSDRCRFPGFVSDDDLPELYRSADLFVLPSRKEGFGIVFLEAIASGLPVIAGNQDGSIDALNHGRLGLLINPDSQTELIEAIRSVINDRLPDHLKDPTALHRECTARFGFDAFRDRLKLSLRQMGWIE